jgi:hypothetical protein
MESPSSRRQVCVTCLRFCYRMRCDVYHLICRPCSLRRFTAPRTGGENTIKASAFSERITLILEV